MKKPINSKQKGAEFELKVAKKFTMWAAPSGEFIRTKNIQCVDFSQRTVGGDVALIKDNQVVKNFPLSIECKKEEGWDLTQVLLRNAKHRFASWWEQSSFDAKAFGKVPVVVFARNFCKEFILYPAEIGGVLDRVSEPHRMLIPVGEENLFVSELEEFFCSFKFPGERNGDLNRI